MAMVRVIPGRIWKSSYRKIPPLKMVGAQLKTKAKVMVPATKETDSRALIFFPASKTKKGAIRVTKSGQRMREDSMTFTL
jgi:hypothetical protein